MPENIESASIEFACFHQFFVVVAYWSVIVVRGTKNYDIGTKEFACFHQSLSYLWCTLIVYCSERYQKISDWLYSFDAQWSKKDLENTMIGFLQATSSICKANSKLTI